MIPDVIVEAFGLGMALGAFAVLALLSYIAVSEWLKYRPHMDTKQAVKAFPSFVRTSVKWEVVPRAIIVSMLVFGVAVVCFYIFMVGLIEVVG